LAVVGFQGLKVLSLESRRAVEMSKLIETYGGQAIAAPSMREVPLRENKAAIDFAKGLIAGHFDLVIFLTGVGARAMWQVLAEVQLSEAFQEALRRTKVAVRGPKPLTVLREWNVPVVFTAPEPCTWRELLAGLANMREGLHGLRVAVQEYGVSNEEFLGALRERGAIVTEVAVYRWEMPVDTAPLRAAVSEVIDHKVAVALFTTGVQVTHLFRMAEQMGEQQRLRAAFERVMVASIGPATTETLQSFGLGVDLETSHPKMGMLVREAAERAAAVHAAKRPLDY
jgi:uroporphyrinogen-III synthase